MGDTGRGSLGDQARERERERLTAQRDGAAKSGINVVQARIPRCAPPRPMKARDPQAVAHYEEARAALGAGDLEAAEAALRRALARDEGALEAWRELGILLVEQGRPDEAVRPLERALDQDGFDYELVRFKAIADDRAGREDEALEGYRLFLTLAPGEHGKPRTHAALRIEQIERGEGPKGEPGPLVEELEPEPQPAVRPGLLLLFALAWGWVIWSEFAPEPAPTRPEGPLKVAHVEELAARADEAALAELASLVVDGHSVADRPPIEAAIKALADRGGPDEIRTLVVALAVVMRRPSFRRWERAHRDAVVAALDRLEPAMVAEILAEELARRGKAVSEVDRRVERTLESQRLKAAGS